MANANFSMTNSQSRRPNPHSPASLNQKELNRGLPIAASRNQNEHGDDQRTMGKAGEKSGE